MLPTYTPIASNQPGFEVVVIRLRQSYDGEVKCDGLGITEDLQQSLLIVQMQHFRLVEE